MGEIEWSSEVRDRSKLIDLRENWCGDRDGDTDRQCTPALHYTGYLVQTVCQYKIMKQVTAAGVNKRQPHLKKYGVGRALPCWELSGWIGTRALVGA